MKGKQNTAEYLNIVNCCIVQYENTETTGLTISTTDSTQCIISENNKSQQQQQLTEAHNPNNALPTLTYLLHVKREKKQDHLDGYSNRACDALC